MAMAHFAATDATGLSSRVEHVVDPAPKDSVVTEDGRRFRSDATEVVVRRIDLGGKGAGMETARAGQYREAAHAAGAEAVIVRFPVSIVDPMGARPGMEEDFVPLEHPIRMRPRPIFQELLGM